MGTETSSLQTPPNVAQIAPFLHTKQKSYLRNIRYFFAYLARVFSPFPTTRNKILSLPTKTAKRV